MNRKVARRHVLSFLADSLEDDLENEANILFGREFSDDDVARIESEGKRIVAELRKRAGERIAEPVSELFPPWPQTEEG